MGDLVEFLLIDNQFWTGMVAVVVFGALKAYVIRTCPSHPHYTPRRGR